MFSAEDWKYAAEQFVNKLPDKVIVHREYYLILRQYFISSIFSFPGSEIGSNPMYDHLFAARN